MKQRNMILLAILGAVLASTTIAGFVYLHEWANLTLTDPSEVHLRRTIMAWCWVTPIALVSCVFPAVLYTIQAD